MVISPLGGANNYCSPLSPAATATNDVCVTVIGTDACMEGSGIVAPSCSLVKIVFGMATNSCGGHICNVSHVSDVAFT